MKPKNFNMRNFLGNEVFRYNCGLDYSEERFRDLQSTSDCGTTACALGYCTVLFPKHWKWTGPQPTLRDGFVTGIRSVPCDHAMQFFGVSFQEASELFYGGRGSTPKQEAARIEKVVRRHGWDYAEKVK